MTKLLHNLPIEDLNKENDYLGVIDKANLIQTILESNTEQFHEIKMFALYGEWGSGKSTLMKYLEQNLKDDFNTFFFDTWQFEKDDNLPQTMLEFLLKKSEDLGEKISGDILKFAEKLFRGLGESVKIKVPLYPQGPSVDINPSEFVKEFEKENISFYEALESFKTEFLRWEDDITKKKPQKYNIIFIDDLDRCEPENVLNLLSAIKLFFTYGEKTIFFFGVDKKAVQQAIQTKYKDVVKSEEYLEKIFDISFSMPEHDNVLKLVSTYFDDRSVEGERLNEKIADFFKQLQFTNPRRLKKVLNKYLLLANASENLHHNHKYAKYIGEIFTEESYGNYFETILSLYLITVKEFYPELFKTLFDFKLKEKYLREVVFKIDNQPISNKWGSVRQSLESSCYKTEIKKSFLKRFSTT
ncbi:KAP family P-loop NTPase fold protein [Kordia sp.]|uniref:KAP family P-loop NTPase fold protein n=1 Tax=Kordia sp. TaxID=1965332 RepID=UPI003D27480D